MSVVWVFVVIALFGTPDQKFIVTNAEYASETECVVGGSVLINVVEKQHPEWVPTRYSCVEKPKDEPA